MRNIAANASLARAHVDDVRIKLRNGNAANRRCSFLIEDRRPAHPAIGGLPHSAAGCAELICCRIAGNSAPLQGTPAAKRSDEPILHALEWLLFGFGGFILFV